jgi:hypothetical protein
MRHLTVTGRFDRALHRRDAFGDEIGLAHQAGAERAVLHAIGRAAALRLISRSRNRRRCGRSRQIGGVGAAKLHGDGMFGGVEAKQALSRSP